MAGAAHRVRPAKSSGPVRPHLHEGSPPASRQHDAATPQEARDSTRGQKSRLSPVWAEVAKVIAEVEAVVAAQAEGGAAVCDDTDSKV